MLRVKRQAGFFQSGGNARMHIAQAANGGEKPKRTSASRQEQFPHRARDLRGVFPRHIRHHNAARARGVIER